MMNNKNWVFKTGGIPDDMFKRSQVPMTKEEVRVVTISKARLCEEHVIWDIGAGTGSISIEAAFIASKGHVYAVEKEKEAVVLIKENTEMFGVSNLTICHGTAPEILNALPDPDRVFIGGSSGNLKEILKIVCKRLQSGGRLVVNAIVLETLITAVEYLKENNFYIDITQISIAKTVEVGSIHMFKSHNPVFVISAEKGSIK